MIFVGGPVHTMSTPAHVEAVRVDRRLITSVGRFADLRGLGDAEVVDLDRVAAGRPVVIMHTSGHGYVANGRDGARNLDGRPTSMTALTGIDMPAGHQSAD